MNKTEQTYRDALLHAMRLRDVPGERIGEALAEVESHLAATGEDPVQAFGPPKQYAEEIAQALDVPRRNWWAIDGWREGVGVVLVALWSAAGTWLMSNGVWALAEGGRAVGGLSPLLVLLVGLVILAGMVGHLVRYTRSRMSRVIDPRTGAVVPTPGARRGIALLVSMPVVLLLLLVAVSYASS